MIPRTLSVQLRRGTAFEWTQKNPVLRAGEPGIELDTQKFKIGNGITPWLILPYFSNDDLVAVMIAAAIADATFEGVPGPQGPAGPQGLIGLTGSQGPAGAQGIPGNTGPAGPQGVKGDTGNTGSTGSTGPQGPKGDTGDVGPTGPQGNPGADYAGPTITVSDTAPSTPAVGDVWIDTSS